MKHHRDRIVIQTPTNSQNEFGENIETWSTLATVWSRFAPVSGSQSYEAGTTGYVRSYEVVMWYRSDVTTKERILYKNQYYQIAGVIEKEDLDRRLILTVHLIEDDN